ncbi:MAG: 2'-5' RNA ligase family protein [Candidatus Woesearchaeota archaeon]
MDDESHNFARQIELELCNKFGLCWGLRQSSHITIKAPFETDKLAPFIQYLESLAKEIVPFNVELKGFNYFDSKVIFLDVRENPSLKELHFHILKDMKEKFGIEPSQFEGDKVKFHSSLALEDVTEEKFEKAKKYLKKYNPNFKFKAKKIGIFYSLGDAGGVIVRKIKLKS